MEYTILIIAVLLGVSKNILTKIVKKKSASFYDTMKMNVITFSLALVTVFFMGISSIKTIFEVPWVLAGCFAVCSLGSLIALMKAMELGSVSLSSLFYSCGFILPTIFGAVYYNEEINAMHIVGIALIVVSFSFSIKKEQGKSFNLGWLFSALAGLFFSGMLAILQKIFASEYAGCKLDNFLCVAFAFIIIMSAIATLLAWFYKERKVQQKEATIEENVDKKVLIRRYGFTVLLGFVMGLLNKTNTFLAGALPSVLLFPIMNGGVILTTTVCSMFIFGEKLSKMQKIGLLVGILGIACITIAKII